MGRPPRSIPRVQANLKVDGLVKRELERRADDAGMPLATYLENVVCRAHRYSGLHLSVDTLPTSLPLTKLRRRVTALDRHQCPSGHGGVEVTVRVEEPLARRLQERSQGFGVSYSAYLRAVLHLAAGFSASGVGDQPDLGLDVDTHPRKGAGQRQAS